MRFMRFMRFIALLACALLAAGAGAAQAGAASQAGVATVAAPAAMSKAEHTLLTSMAQAQVNEIAAARQALDTSKNDGVRKFAQTMVDDHGKALDSIKTLARARNVSLPTEPDAAHKALAARMQKLRGDAFDKAYIKQAGVNDHSKVHSMLVKHADKPKDAELKALVAGMTPTVAAHLDAAKALQGGGAPATR